MKTVAVLGGGPAGAFAAERLARAGLNTIVFDEKLAWEKPCGGGLTYKAYQQYPFLIDNDTPKKLIHETVLGAPKARRSQDDADAAAGDLLALGSEPHAAASAPSGPARRSRRRACWGSSARDRGWRLRHAARHRGSRFLHRRHRRAQSVCARSARSGARSDTMSALGYYVSGRAGSHRYSVSAEAGRLHLGVPALRASFGGHLRQGRAGAVAARAPGTLHGRAGIARKGATFYSHMLPSLETPGWKKNRVAGEGWMAVGDAGGLVDPITGEGLYYAMRSGDLASRVVLDDAHGIGEKAAAYRDVLRARVSRATWNSPRRSPSACFWALSVRLRARSAWCNSCGAVRDSAT